MSVAFYKLSVNEALTPPHAHTRTHTHPHTHTHTHAHIRIRPHTYTRKRTHQEDIEKYIKEKKHAHSLNYK